MTITELMAGKAPGTVKIRHNMWKNDYFFIPYYKYRTSSLYSVDRWYGDVDNTDMAGFDDPWFVDTDDWELYTEPKPKTILYEWMVCNHSLNDWYVYTRLMTEAEMGRWAKLNGHNNVRKTGRQFEV